MSVCQARCATLTNNTVRNNIALQNGNITSDSGQRREADGCGLSGYNGDVDGFVNIVNNLFLENEAVYVRSATGSDVSAGGNAGGVFVGGHITLMFQSNVVNGNTACETCGGDSWGSGRLREAQRLCAYAARAIGERIGIKAGQGWKDSAPAYSPTET